jgi:hypothetical protein
MEEKKYELRTFKDIIEAVTEENVDNFIIDFSNYLKLHLSLKKIKSSPTIIPQHLADSLEIEKDRMVWIDDGKNDVRLIIGVKKEK